MTRIILCGCGGAMGRAVTQIVESRDGFEIAAGIDLRSGGHCHYPVFESFDKCNVEADVIIDFSLPSLLDSMLGYAKAHKLPVIICTTGYSDEQKQQIMAASEELAVFYSGNMSLGINLLIALASKAASVLGGSFDIEIIEKHHNQKVDAPSGTALMIADSISKTLETAPTYEFDRHSRRMKRPKNEIGIHSVRGGTIVGEHEVIFAGESEVVTLSHSAQSKTVFASGAVNASAFMVGKPAGLYDMNSMLSEA